MTSAADLAAYLRAEAARPFTYGAADCCTLIADWFAACRGIDPMVECRAGYSDARTARELVSGYGGPVRAVGRALRRAGAAVTRDPAAGDVAVIKSGEIVGCAIRTARGWALRLDTGLALLPADKVRVLAAWKV